LTPQDKVSIGPASWLGWLTFAAGQIVFAVTAISGSKAELYGPGKWSAIGGVAALIATNLGRQLQAMLKGEAKVILPSDAEELEPQTTQEWTPEPAPVRRESSAVPDGAEQVEPPAPEPPPA
jgi:hypothetical protein